MNIFHVNAFVARDVFSGNPAAVVLSPKSLPVDWMGKIAAEMNLSETAFVVPEEGAGRFSLRWFTPTVEVDLCGHATLASAHVLYTEGIVEPDTRIVFSTRSGDLTCGPHTGDDRLTLDFPAIPSSITTVPSGLLLPNKSRPVMVMRAGKWVLMEVDSEESLRCLDPSSPIVAEANTQAMIVTCEGRGDYDFLSRFFAPRLGVPEDPVTGSAHCVLAPYWKKRLGRDRMVGFQASGRGGIVEVACVGDRVELSGRAVTIYR
ncbi:MAG: PhzF family phenazine biosynthesis protein, partial [Candidatus Sumerlaeia bacterium]|nr:PhzF family phenazine biosynthesis protein [Candidatus Sumerlaeia bacterium]